MLEIYSEGFGFVNCLVPTESSEYTTNGGGGPILTGRSTNLAQLRRHNQPILTGDHLPDSRQQAIETRQDALRGRGRDYLFHLRYYRKEQMWLLALLLTAFARPVLTRDVSTPTWEVSCFGLIVVSSGQPSFAA